MKESLSSYLRRKFGGDDISQAEKETNAIHEMAREFFGKDFPNPERFGCPPKDVFIQIISEGKLPGKELQDHLLGCSECFNEYRAELGLAKAATVSKKNFSNFNIRFALAGGLAIVLIALAGGFLWFRQSGSDSRADMIQTENSNVDPKVSTNTVLGNAETNIDKTIENQSPQIAEKNKNFNRPIDSVDNRVEKENKRNSRSAKEDQSELLAKNEVRIDLNDPIWRDSTSDKNRKAVNLEAKQTRLRITLPKENPSGIYQVFLVDEFAAPLTEKKTVRSKMRNITVDFDLSKIGGKQKRLCFSPVGEIPDCVLVNISAPE